MKGEKNPVTWTQVNLAVTTLKVSGCAERVLFLCSSLYPSFQQPAMPARGEGSSCLCLQLHWCNNREECCLSRYPISEYLRKTHPGVHICMLQAVFACTEPANTGAACLVCPCALPWAGSLAGPEGVCVSAGPNPGSVLALLSLLIFRYTFHLFGGRMLINNDPVRVLFFCLGTFRARFLCADNTNVSLALRGVELCCFLYL